MTDHSLRGYLNRRTTKELQALLTFYLQKENDAHNEYIRQELLAVLQERNKKTQNSHSVDKC